MAENAAGVVQMTPLAMLPVLVMALASQAPPPPQHPASTATPQEQRARGRGIQALTLTSAAWPDGGQIPARYAQPGGEVSPPLSWSGASDTTASFVLIVHDLDAPVGPGTDDVLQWMVWSIPGSATGLPEGLPQGPTLADGKRQISVSGPNYRGPAAPSSGPPHHYVFELYALDAAIDVPAVGASPAQTRAAVVAAMAGHVRGKGVYTGLFRRSSR